MRKFTAIAVQTTRGLARDRIFHGALLFSVLFVLFAFLVSSLSILETRKVLLDFGLAASSIMGICLALFLGVTVAGREIEKRTVYSVLSKPVSRLEYLLAKFAGAVAAIFLVHVLNGLIVYLIASNTEQGAPGGLLQANYLMFLESVLVLAMALCFSFFFSTLFLAASTAGAMFLVGRSSNGFHLLSEKASSPALRWLFRLLYDVVPSLDRFNIRELVAYGKPVPDGVCAVGSAYALVYAGLLLTCAYLAFRRKDLA